MARIRRWKEKLLLVWFTPFTSFVWARPRSRTPGGHSGAARSLGRAQMKVANWIVPANSQTATFSLGWGVNGHNTTTQAQATFDVYGPTLPNVSPTPGSWQVQEGWLVFGCLVAGCNDPGMTLSGSATSPSGDAATTNYEWAQIVEDYGWDETEGSTKYVCTADNVPGLDNTFPYAKGLTASDSPAIALTAG
jgi:hypothetical protein